MIVDGFALEFRFFIRSRQENETCANVSSEGGRNEQALRLIDVSTRYEAVNSARYPPCCSYSYPYPSPPGVYSPRLIVRTFRRIPVTGGRERASIYGPAIKTGLWIRCSLRGKCEKRDAD